MILKVTVAIRDSKVVLHGREMRVGLLVAGAVAHRAIK
jgi:hypothetical protein